MTEKVWSHKDIQSEFADCTSLAEVLEKVTNLRFRDNELVCDIRVNGEFLTEEREQELAKLERAKLERLEITSQSQEELVCSSLATQIELILSLKTQVVRCYTVFRAQSHEETNGLFCTVLEGCQFLAEALSLLKQNLITLEICLSDLGWMAAEDKFQIAVRELLGSFEQKDFQLAADVLEYELGESLGEWSEVLGRALSEMTSGSKTYREV